MLHSRPTITSTPRVFVEASRVITALDVGLFAGSKTADLRLNNYYVLDL